MYIHICIYIYVCMYTYIYIYYIFTHVCLFLVVDFSCVRSATAVVPPPITKLRVLNWEPRYTLNINTPYAYTH